MAGPWVKLFISILDERNIVILSDSEWRSYITSYVNDPDNQHYDHYKPSQARYGWIKVRRKIAPEVFKRDPHCCHYCGTTEQLEIDHIIPLSRHGTNELDNLQILCRRCNGHKRDKICQPGENYTPKQ